MKRIKRIQKARIDAVKFYDSSCVFCDRSKPDVQIEGSHLIKIGCKCPQLGLKSGLEVADDPRGILAMCAECHRKFEILPLVNRLMLIFIECDKKTKGRILEFCESIKTNDEWRRYIKGVDFSDIDETTKEYKEDLDRARICESNPLAPMIIVDQNWLSENEAYNDFIQIYMPDPQKDEVKPAEIKKEIKNV